MELNLEDIRNIAYATANSLSNDPFIQDEIVSTVVLRFLELGPDKYMSISKCAKQAFLKDLRAKRYEDKFLKMYFEILDPPTEQKEIFRVSGRDKTLLKMLEKGYPLNEISEKLNISIDGIRYRIKNRLFESDGDSNDELFFITLNK